MKLLNYAFKDEYRDLPHYYSNLTECDSTLENDKIKDIFQSLPHGNFLISFKYRRKISLYEETDEDNFSAFAHIIEKDETVVIRFLLTHEKATPIALESIFTVEMFNGKISALNIECFIINLEKDTKEKITNSEKSKEVQDIIFEEFIKVCLFLDQINNKTVVMGKHTIVYKTRSGKRKPLDVTYISSKSYIAKNKDKFPASIEWHHSWLKRGHWRRITGIGKNRNGERIEDNRTWVTETTVNKGLPFINKLRVIK